jgi:hypothetical protein
MKALGYIRDRLSEPGTMRSLVVVLIGIQQGASAASMTDALVALALVALGAVSATMPERK